MRKLIAQIEEQTRGRWKGRGMRETQKDRTKWIGTEEKEKKNKESKRKKIKKNERKREKDGGKEEEEEE